VKLLAVVVLSVVFAGVVTVAYVLLWPARLVLRGSRC
jgi:hypothetical protein